MDPNIYTAKLISMHGATQIPISEFEASTWHNSRVCVWCFQGQIIDLGKKLQLLKHKLRLDCSWGETVKPILGCVLNSPLERL